MDEGWSKSKGVETGFCFLQEKNSKKKSNADHLFMGHKTHYIILIMNEVTPGLNWPAYRQAGYLITIKHYW